MLRLLYELFYKITMFALVDCNNFFVSCEKVFRPDLKGKPVLVLSNNDGCAVSRSQEIKNLGIPMGAPYFKYKHILEKHSAKTFSGNFSLYGNISQRVMSCLRHINGPIEVYSIDEAFLDITHIPEKEYDNYAYEIKTAVLQWTGIPISIGIAPTKTLAKAANHIAKTQPEYNNVCVFTKDNTDILLQKISVSDIWGIGRQLSKKLSTHGITNAYQLKQEPIEKIKKLLHTNGVYKSLELRGQPCTQIDTEFLYIRKGILSSRSFGSPIITLNELKEATALYTARACHKLRKQHSLAQTITVFIKTNRHSKPYYSNSYTIQLEEPTNYTPTFISAAHKGLLRIYQNNKHYKKAGIYLSNIRPAHQKQSSLFENTKDNEKKDRIMKTLDRLTAKHGSQSIFIAAEGIKKQWYAKSETRSPAYLTNWKELPKSH